MLEKELLWNSTEYGFFTSAYGWFNVFLLMLIFGGIILDKKGSVLQEICQQLLW